MDWITPIIEYPGALAIKAKGSKVLLLQDFLRLAGINLASDGHFGPATQRALSRFQRDRVGTGNGVLDAKTWEWLTARFRGAMLLHKTRAVLTNGSLLQTAVALAHFHREAGAQELDRRNRGPWVRAYCKGQDGPAYAWCAGFVSFVLAQAGVLHGQQVPFPYTLSVDTLANSPYFVGGTTLVGRAVTPPAAIFLIRNPRNAKDWRHTGFAFDFQRVAGKMTFKTVEGNTNTGGSREGTHVLERYRVVQSTTDFLILPPSR